MDERNSLDERIRSKLSATQKRALVRMLKDGYDLCPGGYPTAGPDASRWWRTMWILADRGLVERRGHQAYKLLPKGERVARSLQEGESR